MNIRGQKNRESQSKSYLEKLKSWSWISFYLELMQKLGAAAVELCWVSGVAARASAGSW